MSKSVLDNSIQPAPDWEYYIAWMQCDKITHLVRELQERMHSGVNIHELVEAPTLDKLAEEIQELWWHTVVREEDLQIQLFGELLEFRLCMVKRPMQCRVDE